MFIRAVEVDGKVDALHFSTNYKYIKKLRILTCLLENSALSISLSLVKTMSVGLTDFRLF